MTDTPSAYATTGLPGSDVAPLTLGYDVDVNAVRFSNYFHVLRELVHLSEGWLPLVPEFSRKLALGEHIHDDARDLSKVRRRLYELRHPSDYPGAPGEQLTRLLDAAAAATTVETYLAIAYGQLKPLLVRACAIHLANLDPVTDEPSLVLLRKLLDRQRRHVAEYRSRLTGYTFTRAARDAAHTPQLDSAALATAVASTSQIDDLGTQPIALREKRTLTVFAPLERPMRDPGIAITDDGDPYLTDELYVNGDENHVPTEPEEQRHFFHGLMDAEICAAELMARNSHEHPEMPWDFHVDMARQVWDELRHGHVHEVLMATELGCNWGDYPIGFSYFMSIYRLDLLARLALFNGTSEQKAMWRHSHRRKVLVELGQAQIAKVFDYLLADEVPHVHNGIRWGSHLLGGDERAYKQKVQELRETLDRTGQPVETDA